MRQRLLPAETQRGQALCSAQASPGAFPGGVCVAGCIGGGVADTGGIQGGDATGAREGGYVGLNCRQILCKNQRAASAGATAKRSGRPPAPARAQAGGRAQAHISTVHSKLVRRAAPRHRTAAPAAAPRPAGRCSLQPVLALLTQLLLEPAARRATARSAPRRQRRCSCSAPAAPQRAPPPPP